jgi:hypothetical protein
LAGPEVGHVLEALGAISTVPLRADVARLPEDAALHTLRSCYDHLAGRVAVDLARVLETAGAIRAVGEREYELGPRGQRWFRRLGIDTDALRGSRRSFAHRCLDWTERRPHVAGALGAALLGRVVALGWVARRKRTRALRITHLGAQELERRFAIRS